MGALCEHQAGGVDGPCTHWPEGVQTWPELEALNPAAAEACHRECWMGLHFRPSRDCVLDAGHYGPHDFEPLDGAP